MPRHGKIPMTKIIPHLDAQTEAALEAMVDKCGLATVLNGLSSVDPDHENPVTQEWRVYYDYLER
jgi:hypothetical protein